MSGRLTLDEIRSALPYLRERGNKFKGPCPACQHERFEVFRGREGWTPKCHRATCPGAIEAIRAALGSGHVVVVARPEPTIKPPMPWRGPGPGRKVVARYDYTDAQGRSTGSKLRIEPGRGDRRKDFVWLHGADLMGRPSPDRHLYRLRAIAADPTATVIIVEGEKCVHALDGRVPPGYVATCPSDGAGSDAALYLGQVRGRHVVILPDHDKPGADFARDWHALLLGVAASVQVVPLHGAQGIRLDVGDDVVEWLDAGGDLTLLLDDAAMDAEDGPPVDDTPHPAEAEAPKREHRPVFVLPKGNYGVLIGDEWRVYCERAAIARLREDGLAPDDAYLTVKDAWGAVGIDFAIPDVTPVVERGDVRVLNTYRGIPAAVTGAVTSADFPAIQALLDHLLPVEADQGWLLDFLAMPLQELAAGRPGWRTHVCPLLKGVPGAGKGFLCEVIGALYGRHMLVIGQEQLEDDFSPVLLRSALFVVVDELESPRKWNKVKMWVTEPTINVRDMGVAAQQVAAHFNLLMTSNLERPVGIAEDDRRVQPFECASRLPSEVMAALIAEKTAGWPSVPKWHRWLLSRQVELRRMKPIGNAARKALIAASEDVWHEFVAELWAVGADALVETYSEDLWPRAQYAPEWQRVADRSTAQGMVYGCVTVDVMARLFRAWAHHRRGRRDADPKTLWALLERRGVVRGLTRWFGRSAAKCIDRVPMRPVEADQRVSAQAPN